MNANDLISLISKIREKVNRLIISELAVHGVEGIVTSHGDIIYALIQKPKMTMAEIAAKIGKDKSTVTALVDKLVKLGYVAKERGTEDTRIIYVTLTRKGLDLKPVFDEISQKVLDVFYTDVSEKEKEVIFQILNKIYNNF
ncbi:MarR family transcriptional regulator [Anaerocolumna sedimenticola]|uniref:MarR family transcriptional regulator n=1 Tax=Anaerocolumna sedimenticola TaxID=2696063 RepID=A0A6P1TPU6_9FIRM|nr:MarR family transcriptional regulator [Anaerocolumna sedimenticola]QHQ61418.1 MarR family transcriptional regulator [Anaerocolumna sedimenticola]